MRRKLVFLRLYNLNLITKKYQMNPATGHSTENLTKSVKMMKRKKEQGAAQIKKD